MQMNLQEFFKGLGDRCWKENDLSDVTYAMCRGSKVFFQFFLDFFFTNEFALDAGDAEITREVDDGNGNRPDFRIETRKGVFYIEVKIWDGNQHFAEYTKSLQKANEEYHEDEATARKRLGYIVNYPLTQSGHVVHRWEELIEHLKRYDCFNDEGIRGYAEFVKHVCGLRENEDIDSYRFNPDDFTKIRQFMADVLRAIDDHRAEGVTPYHRNRTKCFQQNFKMGKVFELANFRGTGKPVWGWLGCFFNDSRPEIVVQFENQRGWGDLVCQAYKAPHEQESSAYYDEYDQALYFYMVETDANLHDFFDRVLETIKAPYDPAMPAFPSQKQFARYDYLLSMRRFPNAVKKHFFEKLNDLGNGRSLQVTGQDDNPSSHSHVTFQIHKTEDQAETNVLGWVGVDFGNENSVPQFRFAFGEEASETLVPPINKEENVLAWSTAFHAQLKEKLRERNSP